MSLKDYHNKVSNQTGLKVIVCLTKTFHILKKQQQHDIQIKADMLVYQSAHEWDTFKHFQADSG